MREGRRPTAMEVAARLKGWSGNKDYLGLDIVLYESVFDPTFVALAGELDPPLRRPHEATDAKGRPWIELSEFPARVDRQGRIHLPTSLLWGWESLSLAVGWAGAFLALRTILERREGRLIWGIAGERAMCAALTVTECGDWGPNATEVAERFGFPRRRRELCSNEDLDAEEIALAMLVLVDACRSRGLFAGSALPNDFVAAWYRGLKRALLMRVLRFGIGSVEFFGLRSVTDHELIVLVHRLRRCIRKRRQTPATVRLHEYRGDGSSRGEAIFVNRVEEEYAWIKENCPGFERNRQWVVELGPESFDVLELRGPGGEERTVWFNISRYYRAAARAW